MSLMSALCLTSVSGQCAREAKVEAFASPILKMKASRQVAEEALASMIQGAGEVGY